MFGKKWAGKKKSLTDPVPIIPFLNQPVKEEPKVIPIKKKEPVTEGSSAVATAPIVKPKPTVKVVAKGTPNLKSKHLSISSVLNPENQVEDDFANTENKPRTEFNQDELKSALRKLANQLQKDGRTSLASTLINSDFIIEKNFMLKAEIRSTVEQGSIEQNKLEIIGFLRRTLKNWGIDIRYEVVKKENSDDVQLMTSNDKFKKMSEKNPALLQLQKTFKLDIDF